MCRFSFWVDGVTSTKLCLLSTLLLTLVLSALQAVGMTLERAMSQHGSAADLASLASPSSPVHLRGASPRRHLPQLAESPDRILAETPLGRNGVNAPPWQARHCQMCVLFVTPLPDRSSHTGLQTLAHMSFACLSGSCSTGIANRI